ncbi:unnamed protein product, partial [Brassica oleracea]
NKEYILREEDETPPNFVEVPLPPSDRRRLFGETGGN